jgi:WS/DGAT/MGAT family acyltransferase
VDKARLSKHWNEIWDKPLDPTQPLWQVQVVDYEFDKTAMLFRIHHCIGDGLSLVQLLLTSLSPDAEAIASDVYSSSAFLYGHNKDEEKKKIEIPAPKALVENLTPMATFTKLLQFPRSVLRVLMMKSDRNILHGPSLSGRRFAAWSEPLPDDQVKKLKNSLNVTYNDVLVSCLAGALRQYFIKKGVEPHDIHVAIPVSIRAQATPGVLDNHFAVVMLDLPCSEDNIKTRVETIKNRMDVLKNSGDPVGTFYLFNFLGRFPAVICRAAMNFLSDRVTATLTNVPGPTNPLYAVNKQVHELMFWVPSNHNVGVGLSILSYAGSIRIGVSTDGILCEQPQLIVDAFREEFNRLFVAVNQT